MNKFLWGLATGTVGFYAFNQYNKKESTQGLNIEQSNTVKTYIQDHKLSKMLRQTLLNGYMQINKAFLDYGLRQRLQGFSYYGTFFNKDQMSKNQITNAYCIFSPKQQLCGHPSIQHGGATATIADQNSGILAMISSRQLVATGQLKIKYLVPVKRGQIYVWKGSISSREGRKIVIKSTVNQLQTGKICAQCEAAMITVNWQHKMGKVFHYLFNKDQNQKHQQQLTK